MGRDELRLGAVVAHLQRDGQRPELRRVELELDPLLAPVLAQAHQLLAQLL